MAVRKLLLLCFFLSLTTVTVLAQSNDDLSSTYQFNVTLVEDNYWLYWNFSSTKQTISFAVRVKTTGWIGFGISPTGQMPESDVVIGWIGTDGNNFFHDRYATQRATPPIDPIQNWFLTDASVNNGYTTLKFYRNFTSCDTRDLNIQYETAHVVYSWNDQKPTGTTPETFSLMPHSTKGSASVNLLGGLPDPPSIPSNAETLTIATNGITIPNSNTTYWCKAARLPDDVRQSTKYIIKFSPSISSGNELYVHHVLVYLCNGLQDTDLGQGGSCFTGGVSQRVAACTTQLLIAAWAIGGSEFVYPSNVAYPIGGPGNNQFIVIETHYNNPSRQSGVMDSSGITFTYVSTRRQYDAGVLFFGHRVRTSMVVPPNAANFTITGICPGACTRELFPEGGIHIFANLLHTHLAGTGLSFRHLRNTTCPNGAKRVQEQRTVDKNLQYDFNFQQTTHLPEVINVLPGDTLTLECYYRTVGRTAVTLGGESTREEMCLSFPVYYPRIDDEFCASTPAFNNYRDFVSRYVPASNQAALNSADPNSRSSIADNLNLLDWTQEQIDGYERLIYTEGQQVSRCGSIRPINATPSICCPYETANSCTRYVPTPCCERSVCAEPNSVTPPPGDASSTAYISMYLILAIVLMTLSVIY